MTVEILHKRSGVQFKNASGNQLEFGELAINYHESGPYLQVKGSDGVVTALGGVYITDQSADAPANPQPGRFWLRGEGLFVWKGSAWVAVTGTGGGGGGGDITTVLGGDGITAVESGGTVTVTADLGAGLAFDADGKIEATGGGGGTAGNGKLTINDSSGTKLAEFTANQATGTDTTLSLPAGFSGDYDDLTNKPTLPTVEAGDGISVSLEGSAYTVAASVGTGLFINGDGEIEAVATGGGITGTVDVTSAVIPPSPSDGQLYINTGDGNFSAEWAAVVTNAGTVDTAASGDLLLYSSETWEWIPTSGGGGNTNLGQSNLSSNSLDITSSTGTGTTLEGATTDTAGLLTGTDKIKLNAALINITAGSNVSVTQTTNNEGAVVPGDLTVSANTQVGTTNLSIANRDASTLDIASDTGTDATIPAATTLLAGLLTAADKTALDGAMPYAIHNLDPLPVPA